MSATAFARQQCRHLAGKQLGNTPAHICGLTTQLPYNGRAIERDAANVSSLIRHYCETPLLERIYRVGMWHAIQISDL